MEKKPKNNYRQIKSVKNREERAREKSSYLVHKTTTLYFKELNEYSRTN
jgi:hypothetical protein